MEFVYSNVQIVDEISNFKKTISSLYKIFWDEIKKEYFLWIEPERERHYPYGLLIEGAELPKEATPFVIREETVEKYHAIKRKNVKFNKISFTDPKRVSQYIKDYVMVKEDKEEYEEDRGGYENHIRYQVRSSIDLGLFWGMNYELSVDDIYPVEYDSEFFEDARKSMAYENVDKKLLDAILPLLLTPIPNLPIMAFDIEVMPRGNVMPNARLAPEPVTSIGFAFTEGQSITNGYKNVVIALSSYTRQIPLGFNLQLMERLRTDELKLEWYDDEVDLLERFNEILYHSKVAIVATFSGDDFDFRYLANRMEILGIKNNHLVSRGDRNKPDKYRMEIRCDIDDIVHYKIHVDLYKFFKQPVIKNYAFSGKYADNKLNSITEALINETKVDYEGDLAELEIFSLCNYNIQDALITLKLFTFDNRIVLHLMIYLMRLGFETLGEVHRYAITDKIGNLLLWRLYNKNWVLWRKRELPKAEATVKSKGDKDFAGADIIEPITGVHWDVEVYDFTGLYTNIIRLRNFSPETMNCPHEECKYNKVPGLTHHACKLEVGTVPEIVGLITLIRANFFKRLAKGNKSKGIPPNPLFTPIEQTLKTIGNAAYGGVSAVFFILFSIVFAEAVTSTGRYSLRAIAEKARKLLMQVIYGDTDSIFLKNCKPDAVKELFKFSDEELKLNLELEKKARFVIFTGRKKNYLFMYHDGTYDLKGLKGKKTSTPQIAKDCLEDIVYRLSKMMNPNELTQTKIDIEEIIRKYVSIIRRKKGNIEDYIFYAKLNKPISSYKANSQHLKAAIMRADHIRRNLPKITADTLSNDDVIPIGHIQGYIKADGHESNSNVLPVVMSENRYLDMNAYLKELSSTVGQITDGFGINISNLMKSDKQKGLGGFLK